MVTVLVVDDDEQVRKFVGRVLGKEGAKVIEATNGKDGVELYKANRPDMVVIDIIMPEKDGLTAIKEINKIKGQSKIVAISGGLVLTPEAYLEEAEEIGADFILPKPIDSKKLVSILQNL